MLQSYNTLNSVVVEVVEQRSMKCKRNAQKQVKMHVFYILIFYIYIKKRNDSITTTGVTE